MKERPILMSAPMVRAILDGRKTQTRRPYKVKNGQPWPKPNDLPVMQQAVRLCPFGAVGDRLWVREAFALLDAYGQHERGGKRWGPWGGLPTTVSPDGTQIVYYREGFDRCGAPRWRPSIHMPRWASRITLEITNVRVERLKEIIEADAIAEGIEQTDPFFGCPCWRDYMEADPEASSFPDDPVGSYASLWESLHGPDSWEQNPWVWVIEFRRVEQ